MVASRPLVLATLTVTGLAAIVCGSRTAMATGRNLVPNGSFDRNIDGWTGNVGHCSTWSGVCWSSQDADGDPASGSAFLTAATSILSVATLTSRCFPVTGGEAYTFGVDGKFNLLNYYTGAEAILSLFRTSNCHTTAVKRVAISVEDSDGWVRRQQSITLDSNVVAASVRLGVIISPFLQRAPNRAYFDNVELVSASPPASTTTTAPSSGSTTTLPTCRGSCGDAAADGIIFPSDALIILLAATRSWPCEPCVCDVNSSGTVNATDALFALAASVDASVQLVCPSPVVARQTAGGVAAR